MRRIFVFIVVCALMIPTVAYAHVTGAFKDFLVDMKDESATERLVEELEQTRVQIEHLTPHVDRLNAAFTVKQDEQIPMLQFYRSVGFDVLMNFILDAETIVDVLANLLLVERKLDEDLQQLNRLYREYMTVKTARDALSNYEKLLTMIESNLQARRQFLDEYGHLPDEELVKAAESLWKDEAAVLDEILLEDRKIIDRRIRQMTVRDSARSPLRVEESLVNRYTKLDYYFQSDHVYVHYAESDVDIILIGIVSKDDPRTSSLKFEAGFMNGIRIADMYMDQMAGFVLDYGRLMPESEGHSVEQTNGAIVLMPIEYMGE